MIAIKQNADGTVAAANKLVFTNTYSVKSSVTLTGIQAQKGASRPPSGLRPTASTSICALPRHAHARGYKDVSGVPGCVK